MSFAVGRSALGLCDRCNQSWLLSELKGETVKGFPLGNRVCPECWDPDHPQNFVGTVRIFDPESLRDPRPDSGIDEINAFLDVNVKVSNVGTVMFVGYAVGAPSAYHDGIGYDASTGVCYVKQPGNPPTIGVLTDFFTFTGDNKSKYRGSAGLLVQSATNIPRIEYNASGAVVGLLGENARTNVCLQSEAFNVTWNVGQASIGVDATTGPDGGSTADKLIENTASATHNTGQAITIVADAAYAFSVFVKAAGRTAGKMQFKDAATGLQGISIDFDLTTLATSAIAFGSGTLLRSSLTAYANGWYRAEVAGSIGGGITAANISIFPQNPYLTTSYTGDGTSGLYLYGAQLESGRFASSYIPTTTGSVTRAAEICTRTLGAEFSSTAGTIIVRGTASAGQDATLGQAVWSLDDNTLNERFTITRPLGGDTARFGVTDGGASQAVLDATFVNATAFTAGTAWQVNDFAFSFNAASSLTDVAGSLPTTTFLQLLGAASGSQGNCYIKSFDYYPARQPNSYLEVL